MRLRAQRLDRERNEALIKATPRAEEPDEPEAPLRARIEERVAAERERAVAGRPRRALASRTPAKNDPLNGAVFQTESWIVAATVQQGSAHAKLATDVVDGLLEPLTDEEKEAEAAEAKPKPRLPGTVRLRPAQELPGLLGGVPASREKRR